jgi:hypothetical protein
VNNSAAISRRRRPRARADIRFQPVPGGLSLDDIRSRQSRPVTLVAALVLTYCDGRHDPRAIADAVAGSLADDGNAEAIRADVHRIIDSFTTEGIVD